MRDEHEIIAGTGMLPAMDVTPSAAPVSVVTRAAPPQRPDKRRHADRFAVLNAFADCGARLVNTTAQACWWILYRETKPDGLARVSHEQIGECIARSRVTVTLALKRLEKAGLIEVVKRGGLHKGMSTYRVHGAPVHKPKSLPGITR